MRVLYILIISLFSILILIGCSNKNIANKKETDSTPYEDNTQETVNNNDIKTYVDDRFEFSVDYPANWNTKASVTIEATDQHEGTPDSGINIYIGENEENRIYVFSQSGHIGIPNLNSYDSEDFSTISGLSGTLYLRDDGDQKEIVLLLKDDFIGAIGYVSEQCYSENKEQIINMFKSIRLEDK